MRRISDTIESDAIAVIGMCKNAGKTTVLNALINDMANITLGITSIGRDGEAIDLATKTPKPEVYVKEGTIFATAHMLLPLCDTTLEILDVSSITTALGEVVVACAKSDGNIQIAGPSTVDGLRNIHELLLQHNVERMLFDGAISRKSLAVPSLCHELILCSGASYSRSLTQTVKDTAHIAQLFQLDTTPEINTSGKLIVCFNDGNTDAFDSTVDLQSKLRKADYIKHISKLRIHGAVTDTVIKVLLDSGVRDTVVIADSPDRFIVDRQVYEKCSVRNITFYVVSKPKLCAIAVNPYSVYSNSYDDKMFFDAMCNEFEELNINIPIYDVKGGRYS